MNDRQLFDRLREMGLRPHFSNGVIRSRCPTHESDSDSLCTRISPETGKLIVCCHVGCPAVLVMRTIGLKSDTVQVPITVLKKVVEAKQPDPSVLKWWQVTQRVSDDSDVEDHETRLGIPLGGLRRLGAVWSIGLSVLAAPMMDAPGGNLIGVRLRADDGRKWALTGSRNGLFIPRDFTGDGFLYLPEGFTDAAAMAGLGLDAVGRPSCNGGRDMVRSLVRRTGRQVAIVSDRDGPGVAGANLLAEELAGDGARVRIIKPPPFAKDAREWIRGGATKGDIEWAARQRNEW